MKSYILSDTMGDYTLEFSKITPKNISVIYVYNIVL